MYAVISKFLLGYFPNYADRPTVLNWSDTLTGLVMLAFGIGRTLYFILGRFIHNTFNAISQMIFIGAVATFLLGFFSNEWIIIILLFIIGVCVGRLYLVSLSLMLRYEQKRKGAKAGLFESLIGLGTVLSPLIAGIIGTINLELPFFIYGLFALGIWALYIYLKHKMDRILQKLTQ